MGFNRFLSHFKVLWDNYQVVSLSPPTVKYSEFSAKLDCENIANLHFLFMVKSSRLESLLPRKMKSHQPEAARLLTR